MPGQSISYRTTSAELGQYGARVINIRSASSPDSKVFQDAFTSVGEETAKSVFKKITTHD